MLSQMQVAAPPPNVHLFIVYSALPPVILGITPTTRTRVLANLYPVLSTGGESSVSYMNESMLHQLVYFIYQRQIVSIGTCLITAVDI
jgi:hypothetical protein